MFGVTELKTIENLRENTFLCHLQNLASTILTIKRIWFLSIGLSFLIIMNSSMFYLYPSVLCTIGNRTPPIIGISLTFLYLYEQLCMNTLYEQLFLHKAVAAFLADMKLADVKLNCPFAYRSFRGRYQKMMKCSISNLCLVFNLQLHIFQSKVLDKQANLPNMIKTLAWFFTPPDNSYKTFASHEVFRWTRVKTSKVIYSRSDSLSPDRNWGCFLDSNPIQTAILQYTD